jgi:hypothetical protein
MVFRIQKALVWPFPLRNPLVAARAKHLIDEFLAVIVMNGKQLPRK